ncbi:hypothetical protein E3G52_000288 [Mycobacteroides abscessus]|uniref:3'-5' exonuclease n=1 Tax=Mycobacteroides abscessus TaxID=36809 RepID=UPI001877BD3A|nr:exonuclease domain-containing protein [Mycobacteroides abscessus]MBE5453424.1 hypothetical protein [Mycobacteroides abscessus]
MSRDVWVIDVESTGLDRGKHLPVEVAAVNLANGREIYFVPFITAEVRGEADPEAMRLNGYYERALYKDQLGPDATVRCYQDLFDLIAGQTLAGANPRFDADMLMRGYAWATDHEKKYVGGMREAPTNEPWHHRLADVCNYAAARFNIGPDDLPGLAGVCQLLGVTNTAEHSALADARVTADCFHLLYPAKDPK